MSVASRRVGVVMPSVNTVLESWLPYVLPPSIRMASTRMPLAEKVTPETIRAMDEWGLESASTLADSRPDVILYACTASSLLGGREYDVDLMQKLQATTGVRALTTTECMLRAIDHLGVDSVAAASPYAGALARAEHDYLVSCGISVRGEAHLGISNSFELARPTEAEMVQLGLNAWHAASGGARCLFIGCMNLNSHRVAARLEFLIGAPVVTATTSSLWALLRTLGVNTSVRGYGRLLN